MPLSKSQFLRGLQCEKQLWLYNRRKDLIPPTPPDKQALFDSGRQVGELARRYFPGGVLIDQDNQDLGGALNTTLSAVASGATVLYEATVSAEDTLIRADILKRAGKSAKEWDLIEVKQSTDKKEEHLPDVAVQWHVLHMAGFPIRKAYLMLIDTTYVRQGELDVNMLFKMIDVTPEVQPLLRSVPAALAAFHLMLKGEQPDLDIGAHCYKPYECQFTAHCWKDIPDYSVFDITRIGFEKPLELREKGILKVEDVPKGFKLTAIQKAQVDVARSGKPHIEEAKIRKLLKALNPPYYFLDFETVNPAIPPYDGLRPYQQLPFQFSLRIAEPFDSAQGERHVEFLGDAVSDPREKLAALLAGNVGPAGSVIAYHAAFEGRILRDLAVLFPQYAERLDSAADRLWDLEEPFAKRLYVHPEFRGRSSIKVVLPALVPEMSYEGLAIGEGGEASQAFLRLMAVSTGSTGSTSLTIKEVELIRKQLIEYCGQDTLAMQKILEHLQNL